MQNNPVIIISRTDSIGDVVLTLPMAGILKKTLPQSKIIFLGRNYTRDVVALSKHVDDFISYDDLLKHSEKDQIHELKKTGATHIIHVFPVHHIAMLAKQAGIAHRIGTINRYYHWLTCNHRIKLSRKNSNYHEAQLNCKLLEPFGFDKLFSLEELLTYYGFSKIPQLDQEFKSLLDPHKKKIILHPKSKGSAREWGLDNFASLIKLLSQNNYQVFISGTEQEGLLLSKWLKEQTNVVDITGKMNLRQFIAFIAQCDGLVAASTGPLHIAAALGKHAVGLFAPMRPIHPERWRPVGKNAHYLALNKECSDCRKSQNCHCIREIKALEVFYFLDYK